MYILDEVDECNGSEYLINSWENKDIDVLINMIKGYLRETEDYTNIVIKCSEIIKTMNIDDFDDDEENDENKRKETRIYRIFKKHRCNPVNDLDRRICKYDIWKYAVHVKRHAPYSSIETKYGSEETGVSSIRNAIQTIIEKIQWKDEVKEIERIDDALRIYYSSNDWIEFEINVNERESTDYKGHYYQFSQYDVPYGQWIYTVIAELGTYNKHIRHTNISM